jgi:flagellar biogenesis protein FliO
LTKKQRYPLKQIANIIGPEEAPLVYFVNSAYVVVMILVALIVFVFVAYLLVRMFTHNSKRDGQMKSPSDSEL